MMRSTRPTAIRAILREHGRLAEDVATLSDQSDLFEAGLTSHASVNLMLALEEHFEIEFPERMLHRRTFASIAAIRVVPRRARSERAHERAAVGERPARGGAAHRRRRRGPRRGGGRPRGALSSRGHRRAARGAHARRARSPRAGRPRRDDRRGRGRLRDARPVLRVDGDDLRDAPDRGGVPGAPRAVGAVFPPLPGRARASASG